MRQFSKTKAKYFVEDIDARMLPLRQDHTQSKRSFQKSAKYHLEREKE